MAPRWPRSFCCEVFLVVKRGLDGWEKKVIIVITPINRNTTLTPFAGYKVVIEAANKIHKERRYPIQIVCVSVQEAVIFEKGNSMTEK